jgi:hypothetical protein
VLFSSYVDDIALIKNLCQKGLMRHAQLQGQGLCFVLFLRWFGLFITFDQDFLVVGIFFLMCKRVVTIFNCCFCCIILLLISGVKKYLQIKCHLAAKLGTKLAELM